MLRNTELRAAVLVSIIILLCAGCGGGQSTIATPTAGPAPQVESGWPAGLPVDCVQPWEQLDGDGYVMPAQRSASCLSPDSEFCCGAERQQSSLSGVSDLGEACRLSSGDAGSGSVTWAYWRMHMGGVQPGAVSADVNLLPMSNDELSQYYLGLSDYGAGQWQWHGPYSESHLRLSTAEYITEGSDYLSQYGNLFICLAACSGATFDVVGVGANACDDSDTEAPPAPTGLTATPIMGGLELGWQPVIADDLAGYRVYWRDDWFFDQQATGLRSVGWLEGNTRHMLPLSTDAPVHLRAAALDISGNESGMSELVVATPLAGDPPPLQLTASAPSGMLSDAITLTATGADSYDWDLDGDGTYEVTDDTVGTQPADTSATGMIRPAVRGSVGNQSCAACGSVSLLIAGNSRPVATAYANPASGTAPLSVTFTGSGADADGTIEGYAWDFDGDGTYDYNSDTQPNPPVQVYSNAGLYNAKLRVTDDQGAWDVDTVAVNVLAAANNPPAAALTVGSGEESGDTPHTVSFDASGSSDPNAGDSIIRYWWDFDGDGMYDGTTDNGTYTYTYASPGIFTARLKVEDSHGATDTATVQITVNVPGNDPPAADIDANPQGWDAPFEAELYASGSTDSDGTIVRYDWDLDDDDLFEIYDGSADIEHWFNKPGYYDVTVRVTDDDGAQDVASLQVTARGWWHHTFTDSDPDDRISMIVVNGNPAIACEIDESPNGTQYFRATDNMGFGWNDPIKPAANSRYNWVVMKIVSGNPALVYKGDSASVPGETTWHFVRAADADGSTWGTPVEISTDTDLYSPSMAIVDGNPAVVFQWDDWPDCELQYFRATDANGSAWGSAVVVVASTDSQSIYDGNALMVADGNPAIIYRDDTNDDVRYVRATDTAGSTWGAPLPIITEDDPSDDIRRLFPGIVAGNPATVYEYRDDSSTDEVKEDICYIRATDAAGSTWGTPVTVAANWDISDTGNLAIINGYPAFCFEADDYDAPAYCRALDATGSSWGPIELVDGWWTNYDDTCLAEVDGHPAVAYQRTINNNSRHGYLKYAIKIE